MNRNANVNTTYVDISLNLIENGENTVRNYIYIIWASLVAQLVKNLPAMWETLVQSLSWEGPLEEDMATHSSILAWRISWPVKSMGSQRVRHD